MRARFFVVQISAVLLVMISVAACRERASDRVKQRSADTGSLARDQAAAPASVSPPRVDSVSLRAARAELDSLKRRFTYRRDEIQGAGLYSPRAASKRGGTHLQCAVDDDGGLGLISVYVGEDWIFHEQVVVRVRDRVVETAVVPTHDPMNVESVIHALEAVRVFEAVTYQAGADKGVIRAIADADSGRILVRLAGRQANHDFTLPDVDRRAFHDCARLGELLKATSSERKD